MTDPSEIQKRFAARLKADHDEAARIKSEQRADAEAAFAPILPVLDALAAAVRVGNGDYGSIAYRQNLETGDWGTANLQIDASKKNGHSKQIIITYGASLGSYAFFITGLSDDVVKRRLPPKYDPFAGPTSRRLNKDLKIELAQVAELNEALEEDITQFFLGKS